MGFANRIQHAWNAFRDPETVTQTSWNNYSVGYSYRPDRSTLRPGNERSIIASIYNRIAIDVASLSFQHVRLDENGRYKESINSTLNRCLTLEANVDQTGRALIQDIVMSLCDEGCVAVVPTDTTFDPRLTDSYQIDELRVGKILQWFPEQIQVRLYNERTGNKEDIFVPKKMAAIIENPLYAVMNEPNSTLRRLIRKLNLLDLIDEQSGSGKLDLIIQLPFTVRSPQRKAQAEQRRKDIEMQLSGSKYGIAYTDATEHITQLNRPAENNLMNQITLLTQMLYGQLGLSEAILNGTAGEQEQLNYHSRSVEPIASAIVLEMKRAFLTKTAITQGQSIMFFRDPFKLVPASQIADIADKFTRNEVLSSNEVRSIIGYKPVDDPRADELRNKNLNQEKDGEEPVTTKEEDSQDST